MRVSQVSKKMLQLYYCSYLHLFIILPYSIQRAVEEKMISLPQLNERKRRHFSDLSKYSLKYSLYRLFCPIKLP